MAKTNWQDPKTSEIRSTHISGLQEAVGKIEESIGIKTVSETNITLSEVYIADDDRYRIFQAPVGKRNWLSSPAPIIKKNGVVITSGFAIDYGGGGVIFATPILATDILTADATFTKKVEGKGLSTNDYTDEEKLKNQSNKEAIESLAGIGRTTETVKDNADNILALINDVGNLNSLKTTEKANLVLALNEVYQNLVTHQAEKATNDVHGLGYGGALITLSYSQSIPNNENIALVFDIAIQTKHTFFNSLNPTRITIPAGVTVVKITVQVSWYHNDVGVREFSLHKNGDLTSSPRLQIQELPVRSFNTGAGMSSAKQAAGTFHVKEGDYFEVFVQQNSGSALGVNNSGRATFVQIEVIE